MRGRGATSWELTVPTPPREVFAVMEQLLGYFPYRFEPVSADEARIVEDRRRGLFGQWSTRIPRPSSVRCEARATEAGTVIRIVATPGRGRRARPVLSRAWQLVRLLEQGRHDQRTIYRERHIPPGPVTLVASWASMPYRLLSRPEHAAERGAAITTATPLVAVPGGSAGFTRVRTADGDEGYVETDQIVAAPGRATRAAQLEAARHV